MGVHGCYLIPRNVSRMQGDAFSVRVPALNQTASPAHAKNYKVLHFRQYPPTVFRTKLTPQRELVLVSFDTLCRSY